MHSEQSAGAENAMMDGEESTTAAVGIDGSDAEVRSHLPFDRAPAPPWTDSWHRGQVWRQGIAGSGDGHASTKRK